MKTALCFLVCLFITISSTQGVYKASSDAENTLQLLFNGFFEQAGLADPTTVVACFDENSASLTVTFIGTILQQLANNNFNGAQNTANTYSQQLPEDVKTCLSQNAEIAQVSQAYHISGMTLQQIQSKVQKYAMSHFFALHRDVGLANSHFQGGEYKKVGQDGGQLIQKIFGKSEEEESLGDDSQTLQLLFNGFFEQAGLADPTTVVGCFDENSATLTVTFIGTILQQLANNNFNGAQNTANTYSQQLPENVKICLAQNAEIAQVSQAYHISGLTLQQIQSKVQKYAMSHLFALHRDVVLANSHFQGGKYKQVGQDGGQLIQKIFGKSEEIMTPNDSDSLDILQQYFNGFFETGGLDHPTTLVTECFDEDSAQLMDTSIAKIVEQLANKNILGAKSTAFNLIKNLPPSVEPCVTNDAEFMQAIEAYGISGLTPTQVISRVVVYAVTHLQQLTDLDAQIDKAIKEENYTQAGQLIGESLLDIFNPKMIINDI